MAEILDITFRIRADASESQRELEIIRRYVEAQRNKRQEMNPIIYLPPRTRRIPQDLIAWVNRFAVPSFSGKWYVLAQHKTKRFWACSCPGYTRRTERDCKHLRNLGITGGETARELILQAVDGSFTIYSDGRQQSTPPIPDDKTRQLIDRIANRSAKLAGKIVKTQATTQEAAPAKPTARRIVLNEDV